MAERSDGRAVLVVNEIQIVPQWSAVVKELWNEDTDNGSNLLVVLTGSSALLLQKGLREALTGRFEVLRCQQWEHAECREAFGMVWTSTCSSAAPWAPCLCGMTWTGESPTCRT